MHLRSCQLFQPRQIGFKNHLFCELAWTFASASISGSGSMPITCSKRFANGIANCPVPQPRSSNLPVSSLSAGSSLQSAFQGSECLSRVLKQDGLDATGSGGLHMDPGVVEQAYLFRLDPQPLPGQLKAAPIGLRHADLMGVDDQIAHLLDLVALLLFAPGSHKAIGENGRQIGRA